MKAIAKAVTAKKAVKDMNPVTRELRDADKAARDAEKAAIKTNTHILEAARIIAADMPSDAKPLDYHAQALKRAKAIVTADGVVLSKYVWDTFSRYLMLAVAPKDATVTVKKASTRAAGVVSPVATAIDKISARDLSKAAQEVKAQMKGDAAPKAEPKRDAVPRNSQQAKSKPAEAIAFTTVDYANVDIEAALKYWTTHSAQKRTLEAAAEKLGYQLVAKSKSAKAAKPTPTVTKHKANGKAVHVPANA